MSLKDCMPEKDKKDSVLKCPVCDELNMHWNEIENLWQCLNCGYRIEE